jgi:hypothetical protein
MRNNCGLNVCWNCPTLFYKNSSLFLNLWRYTCKDFRLDSVNCVFGFYNLCAPFVILVGKVSFLILPHKRINGILYLCGFLINGIFVASVLRKHYIPQNSFSLSCISLAVWHVAPSCWFNVSFATSIKIISPQFWTENLERSYI